MKALRLLAVAAGATVYGLALAAAGAYRAGRMAKDWWRG